jgi:uncharacterized membrane protein YgcG
MLKIILSTIFLLLAIITPIQAQNNTTNLIRIDVTENQNSLELEFTITQTFNENSQSRRGIYYNLEKLQDGQDYNYSMIRPPTKNGAIEKYSLINEITSYRLRIGDENVLNSVGTYTYNFALKTDKIVNYKHNFTVLKDWRDRLEKVEINLNGQKSCNIIGEDCNLYEQKLVLNPESSAIPPQNVILNYLNVFQSYIYSIFTAIIAWIFGLKNFIRDPYKQKILKQLPHYTPPTNLTPWESYSLIKKGSLSVKDTIASYIFYLNNKGFLELVKEENTLVIRKIKEYPTDLLPSEINTIIDSMIKNGISKGILETGFDENSLDQKIEYFILNKNKDLYKIQPELSPLGTVLVIAFVGFFISYIIFDFIKNILLIGNSFALFLVFIAILLLIFLYIYLKNKDKFSQKGYELMQESVGYRYYIDFIEKEKLDFSNNPQEGVKFYLEVLPYAAQYGLLSKFNKYFRKLDFMPKEIISNTSSFVYSLNSSAFYVPVESYSGGGSSSGGFSGGGGSW